MQTTQPVEAVQRESIAEAFLTKQQVLELVGVSFPTLWDWMRKGQFPSSRVLGQGAGNRTTARWLRSEINQWMASRPPRLFKGATAVWRPDGAAEPLPEPVAAPIAPRRNKQKRRVAK